MFENKEEELTAGWKKLHAEELDLHCSPDTVRVINLRRMRWARHVARMGERRSAQRVWRGSLDERDHLEGLDVGGVIILKWILKK
jgi:hypothetical protein